MSINKNSNKNEKQKVDLLSYYMTTKQQLNFDPRGKTALVLGAGGTGKVLTHQLILSGIRRIYLWNRTPEKAVKLILAMDKKLDIHLVQTRDEMILAQSAADLVVNATTIGLKEGDGLPAPGLQFSSNRVYFDVVYHRETQFLKEAKDAGASRANGLCMLLYQGARSFEIWTKSKAPIKTMKKALMESIKGKGLTLLCPFDI
jgi:shikimate dehydrogenase